MNMEDECWSENSLGLSNLNGSSFILYICYSCVTGECDNNPATGACARIPYFSGPGEYNGQQRGGPNNNCGGEISKLKVDIANYR